MEQEFFVNPESQEQLYFYLIQAWFEAGLFERIVEEWQNYLPLLEKMTFPGDRQRAIRFYLESALHLKRLTGKDEHWIKQAFDENSPQALLAASVLTHYLHKFSLADSYYLKALDLGETGDHQAKQLFLQRRETTISHFIKALAIDEKEKARLEKILSKHPKVNWTDALGHSQIISKTTLVKELKQYARSSHQVVLIGGWIGLIAYLMEREEIPFAKVLNLELDPTATVASLDFNQRLYEQGLYRAEVQDALNYAFEEPHLIVVNTSCEHLADYQRWLAQIPMGTLCFLQSNNMFELEEHVNCHQNLDEFKLSCGLSEIFSADVVELGYGQQRFTVIGKR